MDEVQPTIEDIKADAKRTFRWHLVLPNMLWILMIIVAIGRLENPGLTGTARLIWGLAPLPFMAWAFFAWGAQERLQDEMAQALNGRVALLTQRLTIFWLFGLALLDAAVGLPLSIPGPFNLPAESFGWFEAAFFVLFFNMFAFVIEHRRITPPKSLFAVMREQRHKGKVT